MSDYYEDPTFTINGKPLRGLYIMVSVPKPMMRVTDVAGREHTGELLYAYHYPHAVHDDKTRAVVRFEQRLQRVGLKTGGAVMHFTRPKSLEVA